MGSSVQVSGAAEGEPDLDDFSWHSDAAERVPPLKWLERVESAVSILLIVTIFAALVLQIVSRRLFEPVPWTDELVRYANIMLGFAAAAYAMALGEHIKVDLIDRFFSEVGVRRLKAAVWALILVGAAVLTRVSFPYVLTSAGRTSVALHLPLVWLYGLALVFIALQAVHALANLFVDLGEARRARVEARP